MLRSPPLNVWFSIGLIDKDLWKEAFSYHGEQITITIFKHFFSDLGKDAMYLFFISFHSFGIGPIVFKNHMQSWNDIDNHKAFAGDGIGNCLAFKFRGSMEFEELCRLFAHVDA